MSVDEAEILRRIGAGLDLQGEGDWDERVQAWLIKETEHWVVHVTPMMFNNRILLSTHVQVPYFWTAGWCYDKGPAAVLAALAWNPEVDSDPVGFKKLANDERRTGQEIDEINAALGMR